VNKASSLTDQLLTFAKGGAPIKQCLDIRPLVKASASFASSGTGIPITFHLARDMWTTEVDASQISQVVYNLVINSVQALPRGGEVTIEGENVVIEEPTMFLVKGPYTLLRIIDNGIGIRREHIPHIFDPYFTTKQNGTGLGLTTVFSIVKKHNGHIEVVSEENNGTTFIIWLHARNAEVTGEVNECA
jgi:two-component system cell cycle sensor histidine kinase/response regulator CckA